MHEAARTHLTKSLSNLRYDLEREQDRLTGLRDQVAASEATVARFTTDIAGITATLTELGGTLAGEATT